MFNLNFARVKLVRKGFSINVSSAIYGVPSQKTQIGTHYLASLHSLSIIKLIYVSVNHCKLYVLFLKKRYFELEPELECL